MLTYPLIPLHRLVLSLSEALDHYDQTTRDHQRRVAYIASSIAQTMGLQGPELFDLFLGAALHDIGLIGVEKRRHGQTVDSLHAVHWHSEIGAALLGSHPLLAPAAEIVRYHHIPWRDGEGAEVEGRPVPMSAHIVALADEIERRIHRETHILGQAAHISSEVAAGAGSTFHPDAVTAFLDVSRPPAFWMDTVNRRIYGVLLRQVDWPMRSVDAPALAGLSRVFARVVDAASSWTMVHSAGVSATATALARHMDFSLRELSMMTAAGYLHDIGKLTVPAAILDKEQLLEPADLPFICGHSYHTFRILDSIGGMPQLNEWASFHHERLDGTGYPFGHKGRDLTLGSRILCVADVFTAMIEHRPYRPGTARFRSLQILSGMADAGALDSDVLAVLHKHFDEIDGTRHAAQLEYGQGQEAILAFTRSPPGARWDAAIAL